MVCFDEVRAASVNFNRDTFGNIFIASMLLLIG